jgi:mevalonate kinase
MKNIKVSAPGKIHLLGEHSVVYGKPALLAAINKRVYVEIESRKDKEIEIIIKNIQDDKLIEYVRHAIDVTVKFYKQSLSSGLNLSITSEVPIGCGVGSSAASAVAIAGAVSLFLGQKFDKEKINDIALLIERYNHKNPSGGDNSTSCYGGFIWYRKETKDLKIIKPISFPLSKNILKNFYILNTGKSKELTGEMVTMVKAFMDKNKKQSQKILNDQEFLTKNLLTAFHNNDEEEIIKTIKKGERNLEKLGVVSPHVKKIIRHVEKLGGAAKICGGGGRSKSTGILLVYQKNKMNSMYLPLTLGSEGIRIDPTSLKLRGAGKS